MKKLAPVLYKSMFILPVRHNVYVITLIFLFVMLFGPFCLATQAYEIYQKNISSSLVDDLDTARKLRINGDYKTAIIKLEEIIETAPGFFEAQYNLGLAYAEIENTVKSLRHLEKARKIRENENLQDYSIYNALGWYYMVAGRYNGAENVFKKGLEYEQFAPFDVNRRLYNNLGLLYYTTRDVESARHYLSIAIDKYKSTKAKETLALVDQLAKTQEKLVAQSKRRKDNKRFVIYRKKDVENAIPLLREGLQSEGFTVFVKKSPLGYDKSTNALFIGHNIPLPMSKAAIKLILDNGISLKAIIYPWKFRSGSTDEVQLVHTNIHFNKTIPPEKIEDIMATNSKNKFRQIVKEYTDKFN